MNFLAHLYLSGSSADVRMGNFIGDFVKGAQYGRYKPEVQRGILLHREIDSFTDTHPLVKESVLLLKPVYGRYATVAIDLFFDHFLAKDWTQYSTQPLNEYVDEVHKQLLYRYFQLPTAVKQFLPFIIKSRRLEKYKEFDSLERSLEIMSNNSSLPACQVAAIQNLKDNYSVYNELFANFFKDVRKHVEDSNLRFEERVDLL